MRMFKYVNCVINSGCQKTSTDRYHEDRIGEDLLDKAFTPQERMMKSEDTDVASQ